MRAATADAGDIALERRSSRFPKIILDRIGNEKLDRLAKVISYYFDAACSLAARQDPSARLYKDT